MAIISKLRPLLKPITILKQSSRRSGDNIDIKPTGYVEALTWDRLHFYTIIGWAPFLLFAGFLNLFVGDAVLVDTPEGYVPEDWECERNPVQRMLQRYVFYDHAHGHEYVIGKLAREQDSIMIKQLIDQVKRTQYKYKDYRAWYFHPVILGEQSRADRLASDIQQHRYNLPDHPIQE